MSDKNFIKNITSKDIELSKETIQNLINTKDGELFKTLCDSSDFIFPFLKERISSDFVTLVNKEDLETVFEFSKTYCWDFEDLIVNSWLKFACEDLTDEILELFNSGTIEQKAYAAKYFSVVNDPCAIEYLNKCAFLDFSPLKVNCAIALRTFCDIEALNNMMDKVLKSTDEFEKASALEFVSAYGGKKQIQFVLRNALKSPLAFDIISSLLNYNDFNALKEAINSDELARVLHILLESYPEQISLDTIVCYQIYDLIKFIQTHKTQYATNILLLAKDKFEEFQGDIYSYDLDKNTKNELRKISSYLNSLNLSTQKMQKELENYTLDPLRFELALNITKQKKLYELKETLLVLLNEKKVLLQFVAPVVETLGEFGACDLIKSSVIEEIEDSNIKALIKSYLD